MKRLLVVLAFALNAQAVDFTAAPPIGTVLGGDLITIHVPLACATCPLPTGASVSFGEGRGRDVKIVDRNTLTVITPAQPRVVVTVTITVSDGTRFTGTFSYSGWGGPISSLNYEPVLIPISTNTTPLPGANGSRWISELWYRNSADRSVELFYGFPECPADCATCCQGDQPFPNLTPGATVRVGAGITDGMLAYVQRGGSAGVTFSMRVRDVSRTNENAGTDIPVVRDADLRSDAIELLNVPIDSLSRTGLRIYNARGPDDAVVTLRIFTMTGGDAVVIDQLTVAARGTTQSGFRLLAGYLFIPDLRAAYAQLGDGRYRIEIVPRNTTTFRGWGFAASTNNDTQLVTTVTPQ